MDRRRLLKSGAVLKVAATVTALTLIAAASLLPAKIDQAKLTDPEVLNPNPVVMQIEDPADAVIEEENAEEEEKKQKLGFFARVKLAFALFFAGAGAWIASRIPWKKIFNKRNAIIVLVLAILLLLAYHVGLPMLEEYLRQN